MNDLELIRKCTDNDTAAWQEFIAKFSRLIYKSIYTVLKLKGQKFPSDIIDDLYNDLITSLINDNCKKLRSFKGINNCSLASWLRTVAVNFAIDFLRKQRPAISIDEEIEDGLFIKDRLRDDSHLVIEKKLVYEEQQRHLSECIEQLDIDDQYFIKLFWYRGLSLDKLGAMLKLSKQAANMRRIRVIEKLKDCFQKKGFL